MKIRPIILCGGEGTRLWQKSANNEPKQFINFGGWNLFEKTLKRINFGNGTLWKYAQTVGPAYLGASTHPGGKEEVKCYADI